MVPEIPTHAWWSQARLQAKDPKSTTPAAPQKGVWESESPILGEDGGDPELQEQCWHVMHQLDAITIAPSPAKPLPSKLGLKEGELKPSVALDLVTPMSMSPNFLQLAMDQCGLRQNEQGELVLTNIINPCSSLPITLGFQALRPLLTGLSPGVARLAALQEQEDQLMIEAEKL